MRNFVEEQLARLYVRNSAKTIFRKHLSSDSKSSTQCFWGVDITAPAEKAFTMSLRLLLSIIRPSSLHFTALSPSRDVHMRVVLQRRTPQLSIRNASTAIPPKTIVLEKPDK